MLYDYVCFLVCCILILDVDGHGMLLKPPNRSSIWRIPEFAKYNPPTNYNDNELFCGAVHQTNDPGTECGVCGDPVTDPSPRANEIGGSLYRGIITGQYVSGQIINVEVELTRSHKGAMEWRLCNNPATETQDCFNRNVLQRADGQGSTISVHDTGLYKIKLRLPSGLACDHCIIQWNYRAGNDWGTCKNGTSSVGCGQQETFRGCSDIKISK